MRQTIPDLRAYHDDFNIEHCSVLLERLGYCLDTIHGEGHAAIALQCDAEAMRDDLLSVMSSKQLSLLFNSDVGKGLIIGIFWTKFVEPLMNEDDV